MSGAETLEGATRAWLKTHELTASVHVRQLTDYGDGPALPEEEAAVATAGTRRRYEFRAGRRAAHHALAEHGCDGAVLRAGDGAPIWPDGFTGSISHGGGLCAALVVRDTEAFGCGIDVEDASSPLEGELERMILRRDDVVPDVEVPARIAFSVKEAAYKAVSQLGIRAVEPRDWAVRVDHAGGFELLDVPPAVTPLLARWHFTGFWAICNRTVLAAAVLRGLPGDELRRPRGART